MKESNGNLKGIDVLILFLKFFLIYEGEELDFYRNWKWMVVKKEVKYFITFG